MVMAYEASSCGFVLSDEAEAAGIGCWVLAPTKMEKSVEQRKHKNDDHDAVDVLEKLRAHILAGNRLPTVWVPDRQTRDDRELIRARLELADKVSALKSQIQMLLKRHGVEKPAGLGSGWTVGYRQWLGGLGGQRRTRMGQSARPEQPTAAIEFYRQRTGVNGETSGGTGRRSAAPADH